MKYYGIVTSTLVAAIFVVGLLTSQTMAKSVIGKRSADNDRRSNIVDTIDLLDGSLVQDRQETHPYGEPLEGELSKLLLALRGESWDALHLHEQQRLLEALEILREVLIKRRYIQGSHEGQPSDANHAWQKRLEMLSNGGTDSSPGGVLEARRRMGPEFNPTGW